MSDMPGVPDMYLSSGMFPSGSDVIVWNWSGHSPFRLHQTGARYITDTYYRFLPVSFVWSQSTQTSSDSSQIHHRHITGSSSRPQITPDVGSNDKFKYINGLLIVGIIGTVVHVLQSSFQLCGRQPRHIHQAIQLRTQWTSVRQLPITTLQTIPLVTPHPLGHPTENCQLVNFQQ